MRRVTRRFGDLVEQHVAEDRAFGEALLREGIDTMLTGDIDIDTGKAILRDYIKAPIGFAELGEATGTEPKNLIRMFGPRGNPQAKNLFSVLGCVPGADPEGAARQSKLCCHISIKACVPTLYDAR